MPYTRHSRSARLGAGVADGRGGRAARLVSRGWGSLRRWTARGGFCQRDGGRGRSVLRRLVEEVAQSRRGDERRQGSRGGAEQQQRAAHRTGPKLATALPAGPWVAVLSPRTKAGAHQALQRATARRWESQKIGENLRLGAHSRHSPLALAALCAAPRCPQTTPHAPVPRRQQRPWPGHAIRQARGLVRGGQKSGDRRQPSGSWP